jgi:hypothetical protein
MNKNQETGLCMKEMFEEVRGAKDAAVTLTVSVHVWLQ